ncbi:MAG: bifunctional phosphopantothenoylcysteine decarboxylase/phosphopantothenate--cysteine ligase CoaBC [Candidatus Schekmanbacteria bacterium]|nr:MAG: bifunctional phosphopantothenoylcysteine decarboxylase/phosphopantothenate--cysteine ligase CoaBC [Candidatus Schekmanbacteria bacterium]
MLKGKKITLGVTGGIAAYKACEITREFIKKGAEVKVIMTENACRFITPLTLRYLSGKDVITGMFDEPSETEIKHIALNKETDLLLVAPATANIIGKFANGIADDFLSTFFLSYDGKVVIAPSMNTKMYNHPTTQSNIESLKKLGIIVIPPESGELACGEIGTGRLANVNDIVEKVCNILLKKKDLKGEKILVTAGPTREYIDPFRFISNPSSGKMGYAIAEKAKERGADVTLISGPVSIPVPEDIEIVNITSAEEMKREVLKRAKKSSIIIKAAAVSDFSPEIKSSKKIKKENAKTVLSLKKNPDILKELGKIKKENQILVGFSAETENLIKNASKKLKEKNCDLIVANDIGKKGAGFQSDTNIVTLLAKNKKPEEINCRPKYEIADIILDKILDLRHEK